MTFAGRVVVMNGGRIEQIGRPRAKREPSPNQSVSLMVPRAGGDSFVQSDTYGAPLCSFVPLDPMPIFKIVPLPNGGTRSGLGRARLRLFFGSCPSAPFIQPSDRKLPSCVLKRMESVSGFDYLDDVRSTWRCFGHDKTLPQI